MNKTTPGATRPMVDPDLDAAAILARYWDEKLPAACNFRTISWWLRQTADTGSSRAPAESVSGPSRHKSAKSR